MQTIDFQRLQLRPGMRLLDLGCGDGRHLRATRPHAGIHAIGVDLGTEEVVTAADSLRVMDEGHPLAGKSHSDAGPWLVLRANGYRLPFPDDAFDCVIASEILEHLHADDDAIREISRVLKPGGQLAVSVPRFLPEAVCWALSKEYANSAGGHVRIYRHAQLREKLVDHGYRIDASHHAHSLHSPYWWIRCAVGVDNDQQPIVRLYHRLLVWDMFHKPTLTRALESALDPLIGKSLVFYATKIAAADSPPAEAA